MILPGLHRSRRTGPAWFPLAFSVALGAIVGACASGPAGVHVASAPDGALTDAPRPTEQGATRIVAIHRSKCGSCHTPVQPGSLPRTEAEAAMGRHHRRLKLSDQDWAGMIDYLTGDSVKHAGTTARVP
jgi:hypothetical protein